MPVIAGAPTDRHRTVREHVTLHHCSFPATVLNMVRPLGCQPHRTLAAAAWKLTERQFFAKFQYLFRL